VLGVPEDEGGERYYNSVISLGTSPEGHYRKAHLVPFGEFLPPGFAWLLRCCPFHVRFLAPARRISPLAAAGQKLAVNICYEDAFGEERIAAARAATLLVNVSNDAWFGASLAPEQHLQIGAMRSLEAAAGNARQQHRHHRPPRRTRPGACPPGAVRSAIWKARRRAGRATRLISCGALAGPGGDNPAAGLAWRVPETPMQAIDSVRVRRAHHEASNGARGAPYEPLALIPSSSPP